jgi:alkaline phosphatase D
MTCLPINGLATDKIYRVLPHGSSRELFFFDLRTYRGSNTANRPLALDADTTYLGREQLNALNRCLAASRDLDARG